MTPFKAALSLARAHGLAVRSPVVLRDLSNLLVHLRPAPVVARVATSTAAARGGALDWLAREVEVAGFLADRDAPVVAPATELPPGPHLHEGYAITFWAHVDHDPERPLDGIVVGESLGALHAALTSYRGQLPGLTDVLAEAERLAAALEGSDLIGADEPARLRAVLAQAREAIDGAALPTRALHGDAHAGNVLRTPDGPVWTDFEDTCSGPVEWDLACLAAGSGPRLEALAAYGRCADDPLLAPFVEARALQVAVWAAFMAEHHPQLRERARERLDALLG
jgi:aminoglycoside phosphotransferase (APT) family kinase protein